MKLTIIADDFTGSNDTGVQFAKKRLKTVVTTNLSDLSESILQAEVTVIDTESRFDCAEIAYKKVFELSKRLSVESMKYVYKKLDSTFKGNVGAEIAACMDGFKFDFAVLIPALPSNGRQTINGNVLVNQTLLHLTEVANDPKTPVKKSYIPDILAEQCNKRVHVVTKMASGYDAFVIVEQLRKLREEGVEIVVFDAEDNDDLKQLADALRLYQERFLIIGTAGLAEFLTDALQLRSRRSVLSIIGSVSDVTRKQIDYAAKHNDLMIVDYSIEHMMNAQKRQVVVDSVISKIKTGGHVVVRTAGSISDVQTAQTFAKQMGISNFEISERIAEHLGDLTGKIMDEANEYLNGIFITGGDTLIKIAKHLGIEGMTIIEEVLPAIPMGRFISSKYQDINIVTKAGSFGKEDTFNIILNYLR